MGWLQSLHLTCIGDCILGASWVESMRAVACASAQPAARVVKVSNGARRTMMRPGIHPEFFEEAPVYCNGEQVLTVGGTKKEYYVSCGRGTTPSTRASRPPSWWTRVR